MNQLRGALLGAAVLCLAAAPSPRQRGGPPPPPPERWRGLIGEYGPDTTTRVTILERDGRLVARFDSARSVDLHPAGPGPGMLRFLPPLVIGEEEADLAIDVLRDVLG